MTYHGHIKNGEVAFDTLVNLPEGTPVTIEVLSNESNSHPSLNGGSAAQSSDFFESKSVEQIALQHGIQPVFEISNLYGHFWPVEENLDDFVLAVKEWRRGKN